MTRRRVTSLAGAALLLLAAACGGGDDDAAASARVVEVEMRDIAYDPTELTAAEGETVRFVFRNVGKVDHDAFIGDEAAQADHEALLRRQGLHDAAHAASREQGLGPRTRIRQFFAFFIVIRKGQPTPNTAPAQATQAFAHHDCPQPSCGNAFAAKSVPVGPGANPSVLQNIRRIRLVSHHPPGQGGQPGGFAVHRLVERGVKSGGGSGECRRHRHRTV